MKLIVISNPTYVNNEHISLRSLFENGLEYFHLRKPNHSYEELKVYIEHIPPQYHNKIVLHSHHQLANEYDVKGIHFTQKIRYIKNQELNNRTGLQKSISCHTIDELKNLEAVFDYAFISPVFESISKPGYTASFQLSELKEYLIKRTKTIELIALGGVKEETIPKAVDMGFDGVAVLGSVWNDEHPQEKFQKLKSTVILSKSKNLIKQDASFHSA